MEKENERYFYKKKKRKSRIIGLFICVAVIAAISGAVLFRMKQSEAGEDPNAEETVVLEENQSWLYLQIDTIAGNEMVAGSIDAAGQEELKTYSIPVGTDVVTRLGSVTTFSRLAAGDVIHCLTEQTQDGEVILKIWIAE